MKNRVVAIVPARMGSRRFSGKVLYPYQGKPLVYHLVERLKKVRSIDRLAVATDSRMVARAVEAFDIEVVMTSKRHRTGSDRVAEAAGKLPGDILLNVQGDNFGLSPAALDRAIGLMLAEPAIKYATLARPITSDAELFDPGVVKVITAADGRALWFSRFPLPYLQHARETARAGQFRFLAHVGVYFFRRRALEAFARWPRGPLEKAESLEQLRILENGGRIDVFRTRTGSVSIDRPEDLKKIAGFPK